MAGRGPPEALRALWAAGGSLYDLSEDEDAGDTEDAEDEAAARPISRAGMPRALSESTARTRAKGPLAGRNSFTWDSVDGEPRRFCTTAL